ncbi:MAG TPA: sensor domain-containing diguanylate cyclase [Desulfurivibrionaceae bacterium]|nr:sensor domain-containing diguanylate cyclase [Desulfurivibrionaceae bacterium]
MKKSISPTASEISRPHLLQQFLQNWLGSLTALTGAALIGLGLIPAGAPTPPSMAAAVIMVLLAWRHLRRHRAPEAIPGRAGELEGSLLLLVLSWLVFMLGTWSMALLVVVPLLVLTYLAGRQSWPVLGLCALAAFGMAAGPTALGKATPGPEEIPILPLLLPLALAAGLLLRLLPINRRYRQTLAAKAPQGGKPVKARRDLVRVYGIEASKSSLPDTIQTLDSQPEGADFSRQTLDRLNTSFELQLEMLRHSLDLTTVAVLWPSPDGSEMRLRWLASTRTDLDRGPYSPGRGVLGALTDDHPEVDLLPSGPAHPAIPYYQNQQGIGALLILRLPAEEGGEGDSRHGLLCVDRAASEPWSDRERTILRLAARKVALEVSTSRLLLTLDRDRTAIHRLSLTLRELNSCLEIDSVLAATIKAVKAQVAADLVAVSLLSGEEHRLVMAEGKNVSDLVGKKFPLSQGLVGQAIRVGAILPAGGRYPKPAPIFSPERTFSDFGSLLIFPLRTEENAPLGALVVAGAAPNLFTKGRLEILELITTQVAIKIELAQAHERLGLLATTDGLSGLANHRAFQHGFEVMLQRAKRNRTRLCLLMGDLDHFKQINDTHGHPFGDLVLREVAKIISESVRTVDLAARYGGEEFAIVLENCDATGGHQLAERIRESIGALALDWGGTEPVRPTISLGLAIFPEDCDTKDQLIERADQALYRAKHRGRNRTVIWLPGDED